MLEVPENRLKIFKQNHTTEVERCLTDVIQYWIDNSEVKWEALCEALCHSTVSHKNLGIEIRDWYREKTWRDPRKVNCSIDNRLYIFNYHKVNKTHAYLLPVVKQAHAPIKMTVNIHHSIEPELYIVCIAIVFVPQPIFGLISATREYLYSTP